MGIEYNIDERLYNSLCAGVEKWFEKNKAYVGMHKWEYGNGMSLSSKDIILGGKKYDADFSVNICTDTRLERNRFSFIISLNFRDVISKELEYESKLDILNVINWYNGKVRGCIKYHMWRNIGITTDFYFYKGTVIADDEISRILDEFFFNDYLDELADVIASGLFKIPDHSPIEQTKSAISMDVLDDTTPF